MISGSPAKRVASNPPGSVIFFNASSGESGLSFGFCVLAMPGGSPGGSDGEGADWRASAARATHRVSAILFMMLLRFIFLFIAREQRAALETLNNSSALRQARRNLEIS